MTTANQLHAAIMNLPCVNPHPEDNCGLYSQGHRAARHAAAELVSGDSSLIEVIQEWHERLDNVVAANKIPMPAYITALALCEITEQLRDDMSAILAKSGVAP